MKRFWILIFAGFAFTACGKRDATTETTPSDTTTVAAAPVVNERPLMTVQLIDGNVVDTKKLTSDAVLIFFQPDCDHCQNEARQIARRLDAFKNYQLYFISSHPIDVIRKFAVDYSLADKPNVFFGNTSVESVLNNYGAISAPSIYIYTAEGKLVESFDGEVDVEVIIKYL